jgi:hypothetical protein
LPVSTIILLWQQCKFASEYNNTSPDEDNDMELALSL